MSSSVALRRLIGDRRGTTAIEFGIVGLIFFLLLLGAVDIGRHQITRQSLHSIAAEAARRALISANSASVAGGPCVPPPSSAALKAAVTTPVNLTPFLAPGSLTLTPSCAVGAAGVRTITVVASYPFQFIAPLLPGGALVLTDSVALSY